MSGLPLGTIFYKRLRCHDGSGFPILSPRASHRGIGPACLPGRLLPDGLRRWSVAVVLARPAGHPPFGWLSLAPRVPPGAPAFGFCGECGRGFPRGCGRLCGPVRDLDRSGHREGLCGFICRAFRPQCRGLAGWRSCLGALWCAIGRRFFWRVDVFPGRGSFEGGPACPRRDSSHPSVRLA